MSSFRTPKSPLELRQLSILPLLKVLVMGLCMSMLLTHSKLLNWGFKASKPH